MFVGVKRINLLERMCRSIRCLGWKPLVSTLEVENLLSLNMVCLVTTALKFWNAFDIILAITSSKVGWPTNVGRYVRILNAWGGKWRYGLLINFFYYFRTNIIVVFNRTYLLNVYRVFLYIVHLSITRNLRNTWMRFIRATWC